jgi:CRISPR-associated endonuclease/helicase Cas3
VLDAFADRIGDNTWQTVITQEGLGAVKKLLRKTASKSTAVSCHWIRSRSRSDLLWVVGNRDKFNPQGVVAVNSTEKDVEQYQDKYHWKTLDVVQNAAAIAGLFHDIGKANQLFQNKINPQMETDRFEPYRHEWSSFRVFQAFVGDQSDAQWLAALSDIQQDFSPTYFRDGMDQDVEPKFSAMPEFAQLVAWLIVAHHRLPVYPGWKGNNSPELQHMNQWIDNNFSALWNSYRCNDDDQKKRVSDNWVFRAFPFQSMQWRSKACMLASEARIKLRPFLETETNWLDDQLFATHLSRLALMLADHYYSSLTLEEAFANGSEIWRNPNYKVYANTHRVNNQQQCKQQLDEHLIGVAHHANKITQALPRLNESLESLVPNNTLTENVPKSFEKHFGWQDKARKLAEKIGKNTIDRGFFGINMASTGEGKTRANPKIMVALGLQTGRVRFSVALGLRVLTLQTGKEFQDELKLSDEELAIAVGGGAIKQLFENQQTQSQQRQAAYKSFSPEEMGCESEEGFLDPDLYVHYKGAEKKHSLSAWTTQEKGLDALLRAPVLVSTIDHLMPATDGTKGGKQIPATLRLLTSDLVLDEPDDFGLEDLPALCRLVHWAGMLGSRVLLSTATIPPALAYALFQAYKAGWSQYAKANIKEWGGDIVCAWFDEWGCDNGQYIAFEEFKKAHGKFVNRRIQHLQALPAKRKAEIIKVEPIKDNNIAESMADIIQSGAIRLHQDHSLNQGGKTLSIGLVRMANINHLVTVAKALLALNSPAKTCFHYCIYHSRYPLAIRSSIECKLDRLLNRKQPETIWQESEIQKSIKSHPGIQHHIFIVLASPVAEVGRDHDYDWAIVEPSSMRSIIQLAGRVLRHRELVPSTPNILLLNKNYKALAGNKVVFERPGFESKKLIMTSHDLFAILEKNQFQEITAIQRITLPDSYRYNAMGEYMNLIELEHKALYRRLFDREAGARLWWKNHPHWCGEVQRQQRFRDAKKDEAYYLWLEDKYSDPTRVGNGKMRRYRRQNLENLYLKSIGLNTMSLGLVLIFGLSKMP